MIYFGEFPPAEMSKVRQGKTNTKEPLAGGGRGGWDPSPRNCSSGRLQQSILPAVLAIQIKVVSSPTIGRGHLMRLDVESSFGEVCGSHEVIKEQIHQVRNHLTPRHLAHRWANQLRFVVVVDEVIEKKKKNWPVDTARYRNSTRLNTINR